MLSRLSLLEQKRIQWTKEREELKSLGGLWGGVWNTQEKRYRPSIRSQFRSTLELPVHQEEEPQPKRRTPSLPPISTSYEEETGGGDTSGYASDSAGNDYNASGGCSGESWPRSPAWPLPHFPRRTPDSISSGSGREERAKWGDRGVGVGHLWEPTPLLPPPPLPLSQQPSPAPSWIQRGLQEPPQVLVISHKEELEMATRGAGSGGSSTAGSLAGGCDTPLSLSETSQRSYIRGQNVPLDPAEAEERERKRQRAVEHQNAIKKQLEEKELQRRAEAERVEREERLAEERLRRQQEIERQRLDEERRRAREKQVKEERIAVAMKEALEAAQRKAKEEKARARRRHLREMARSPQLVPSQPQLTSPPAHLLTSQPQLLTSQQQLTSLPSQQQLSSLNSQQQLTSLPSQQQLTSLPSQQQLTSLPSQQQLTSLPSQQVQTSLPSQQQLTSLPSQQQLASQPSQLVSSQQELSSLPSQLVTSQQQPSSQLPVQPPIIQVHRAEIEQTQSLDGGSPSPPRVKVGRAAATTPSKDEQRTATPLKSAVSTPQEINRQTSTAPQLSPTTTGPLSATLSPPSQVKQDEEEEGGRGGEEDGDEGSGNEGEEERREEAVELSVLVERLEIEAGSLRVRPESGGGRLLTPSKYRLSRAVERATQTETREKTTKRYVRPEERPKWGVNRPTNQYVKASDRDPFRRRSRARLLSNRDSSSRSPSPGDDDKASPRSLPSLGRSHHQMGGLKGGRVTRGVGTPRVMQVLPPGIVRKSSASRRIISIRGSIGLNGGRRQTRQPANTLLPKKLEVSEFLTVNQVLNQLMDLKKGLQMKQKEWEITRSPTPFSEMSYH